MTNLQRSLTLQEKKILLPKNGYMGVITDIQRREYGDLDDFRMNDTLSRKPRKDALYFVNPTNVTPQDIISSVVPTMGASSLKQINTLNTKIRKVISDDPETYSDIFNTTYYIVGFLAEELCKPNPKPFGYAQVQYSYTPAQRYSKKLSRGFNVYYHSINVRENLQRKGYGTELTYMVSQHATTMLMAFASIPDTLPLDIDYYAEYESLGGGQVGEYLEANLAGWVDMLNYELPKRKKHYFESTGGF